MKHTKLSWVLLSLFWLSACSTTGDKAGENGDTVDVEDLSGETAGAQDGADAEGQDVAEARVEVGKGAFEGNELNDPDSPLSNRVVYFDYDSAQVREQDVATLEAHAEYLAENPDVSVTLEGHTDERGAREYNLALGERRALSIRQILMLQGAMREQFRVVSFGEERPAADGSNESAYAQNRRVEIKYSGN
jgi:peptidoglycan-associated lipoprotein